ncbi:Hsp20/alpha crystallin family protein [Coraliomargarita parva]|uniref:Hsp20/alpha crystallin family protein n=1 Tax=Coraliomargarita parva TaxID=3014050 RepID=UPI0022B45186|nr:Hsp20/alpha crystallin family protein [Coraliomargarita parva]
MTDHQQNKLPKWAIGLFLALALVVGLQSVWLYRLSDQTTTSQPVAQTNQSSGPLAVNQPSPAANSRPLTPDPLSPDEWDPFAEMQRMREQMDQMFGNAFTHFGPSAGISQNTALNPKVEVSESQKDYTVKVNLPDAENQKIDTKLNGQILTIDARTDSAANSSQPQQQERHIRRFSQSIVFDQAVTSEGMTQNVDNGIIEIHIPKVHA